MNPATLTIKKNNKKKILNYTITNLVTELIHQNLLLEGKEAYYKHGRKTKFLKFNGDFAYVLCAEMSEQDALLLTVCNLLGEKIVSQAIRMSFTATSDNSMQNIMRTLINYICSFLDKLEDSIRQKLRALAVSINGMVDTNKMIDMPLYNWQNVNLSTTLDDYDVLYRLVVEQQMPLTLDTLDLALKNGSIYANELLMETGKYLGYGLVNLINIFDPDLFIISGYGMDFDPFILDVALAEARSRIVNTFRREIRIEHARLKKEENYKALTAYVLNDKLDELASK